MTHDTTLPEHDLRYPVGRFTLPAAGETLPPGLLAGAVTDLAQLPEQLRNAVVGLDPAQVNTPYREGGWTVRQVVHHLADSHMIALFRVKLALTQDKPVVALYDEGAFIRMHDATAPVEWSLELIESLHARWVMLLQSLDELQWRREFLHPERGASSIETATLLYAWHSRHHLAHITHLRAAHGW